MSVCRYLDYNLKKVYVRVNDDACVYACVYVRRPHRKLDLYICTILLMIYVLFV